MPTLTRSSLQPRKTPTQARSADTVDAVLEATLQGLRSVGKERLTSTRVAARAGVAVGTLYQYFPNKTSLLQAALKRHMDEVAAAIERVCTAQRGNTLQAMAAALVEAYLAAKLKDGKRSIALYSISSDVDGFKIAETVSLRCLQLIAGMIATTSNSLTRDPQLVAAMLQSTMAGVSRRLLESNVPATQYPAWREELTGLASAYLATCHT